MPDKSPTTASPIALEDAMLVRQVQDGDMGAFSRLVAKYQDRVVNLCWRVCGNPEDAQDLAQETFLHALEKIGLYRFEAAFYTWLFRIAVNQALSHRRKGRRVTLSLHGGEGRCRPDRRPSWFRLRLNRCRGSVCGNSRWGIRSAGTLAWCGKWRRLPCRYHRLRRSDRRIR